jgi:predicted transposase YbfD/YdcC
VVHDVAWLAEAHAFPGLSAAGKVTATREQDGQTTTTTRYYLLSRSLSAACFLAAGRAHWQIENRLPWVLDVVLDEDLARARKDHAPGNLARLRRFALNVLRANHDQGSTRGKIKRAGGTTPSSSTSLPPPNAIALARRRPLSLQRPLAVRHR